MRTPQLTVKIAHHSARGGDRMKWETTKPEDFPDVILTTGTTGVSSKGTFRVCCLRR